MIKNMSISKFLVILGVNSTSQICINTYTLILEKDFRICEREKSICYTNYVI